MPYRRKRARIGRLRSLAFIDELGDDVRQPEKPTDAAAKANGSDRLAALKAMLG